MPAFALVDDVAGQGRRETGAVGCEGLDGRTTKGTAIAIEAVQFLFLSMWCTESQKPKSKADG